MIRSLFALMALASVSAYATPRVGDYAAYDATINQSGQQYQLVFSHELLQFNSSSNQYLRQQTLTFPGRAPEVTQEWTPADELLTDETINNIMNNCSAAGGSLQNITVPAGNFQTCALPFNSDDGGTGTAWITNVPFGFVRLDSTQSNGVQTSVMLRSFH